METPFDVIILGAGVAGLTAAVHLAAAGHRPLLLEAAKAPGGRARSYTDSGFSEELDNSPHLLLGTYHHTLELLTRLGTRHLLLTEKQVAFTFWDRTFGWQQLACPNWPAPWHLLAGLAHFPGLTARDWLAVLRLGNALRTNQEAWERQSVSHWLQAHHQTATLTRRLWHPICLATLNESPASANAALFAAVLRRLFLTDRHAAQPLLPTVPLSHLLAEPARKFIEQAGGAVRCGCRVLGLEASDDIIQAIHTNQGSWLRPKAIIAALPYSTLARLLPVWAARRGITQLQSAPIVTVHLTYPLSLNLPKVMVGLPQERSQWLLDRGQLQAKAPATNQLVQLPGGGRFSAVLSAAYRERTWSPAQLITAVHQDLARILPELALLRPTAARVIKEHRATFAAWPDTSQYRPSTQTPWPNFWLAGDWTNTGLPATLEGAAQSGVQAAQKTLDLWAREG